MYNSVFVLDCATKTNQFGMPLLHIVGVSSSNTTFTVAFCFIRDNQEESYIYALKSLFSLLNPLQSHPVFCSDLDLPLVSAVSVVCPESPHLFCIWNINKHFTSGTKKCFTTADEFKGFLKAWNKLMYVATEEGYNLGLFELEERYQNYPSALQYLKEVLLIHKERFVVAWTRQCLHLGNSATSRVERSRAFLKMNMGSSSRDSLIDIKTMSNALSNQHVKLRYDLSRDRITRPTLAFNPFYDNIATKTSCYSIRLIDEQASKARCATDTAPLPPCTDVFSRAMGLPCSHRIATWLEKKEPILLEEVHPFWRAGLCKSTPTLAPSQEPSIPLPRLSLPKRTHDQVEQGSEKNAVNQTVSVKRKAPSQCSSCGK